MRSVHTVGQVLRQLAFEQQSAEYYEFHIRTLILNDNDLDKLREQRAYHKRAIRHLLKQLVLC